ncbi:MAG: hypothetical protein Q8R76_03610 [Candidatus Omnitrophota bacterium]|nr:hypothetical protein [Candidatus Omnitrophota bacterium]
MQKLVIAVGLMAIIAIAAVSSVKVQRLNSELEIVQAESREWSAKVKAQTEQLAAHEEVIAALAASKVQAEELQTALATEMETLKELRHENSGLKVQIAELQSPLSAPEAEASQAEV